MSNGSAHPALKLDVLVVFFAYGGNGGVAMQLPAIGDWWANTFQTMKSDPRIGRVSAVTLADTPITMTRNRAVRLARENGFHVLVMIDSDNEPDIYLGKDPSAKPFWDSCFEFVYQRYAHGLPTVIAAPYCGPPPHPTKGGEENVYVFRWTGFESDSQEDGYKLEGWPRAEAAHMAGIHPAGALPTGCLMATVSAFDLVCPDGKPAAHFYYEWSDEWETDKGSTEDVTATRDISLAGQILLEQEVVFCNWDCWAGHHKPKCVGRPKVPSANTVGKVLMESVAHGIDPRARMQYINTKFPRYSAILTPDEAARTQGAVRGKACEAPRTASVEPFMPVGPGHNGNGKPHCDDQIADARNYLLNAVAVHAAGFDRKLRTVDASGTPDAGIAYALCGQGVATCYVVAKTADALIFGSNDIRLVEEDPIEFAASMDPQEADVVWCGDSQSVVEMWEAHVRPGGLLVGMAPATSPEGWKPLKSDKVWCAEWAAAPREKPKARRRVKK